MKQLITVLTAGILLSACNHKQTETASDTSTSQVVVLSEDNLFNSRDIMGFLQQHPQPDDQANALFMQGVDAFRNKKDIPGAITLFRQSALKYPTAKAYYELGNAFMDTKDYAKAISAYKIGEQLGFEPLSKLLYNTACAWSLNGHKDTAVAYLEYAIEAGYANTDQIMKDPDLANARQSDLFSTTYQSALGGHGDPESVAWQSFKRGFSLASFPLVLNKETEAEFSIGTDRNAHYISYEFEKFVPEMKSERFSREVGKEFYYLTKVSDQPEFTTVVYAVKNVMMGDGAPVAYMLASFTSKGKLIDKMIAGGQLNPGDLYRVASIQQSGQFEVKEYKQEYEKDPAENGYSENKLLSSDLKNTMHYRISGDGHFETDSRLIGMKY